MSFSAICKQEAKPKKYAIMLLEYVMIDSQKDEIMMSEAVVLICPNCGSRDVLAGKKWCICDNCGERFSRLQQQEEKRLKLFVSYSHREEEICARIVRALQARGHEVWFDHDNIRAGDDWRSAIAEGILSSNGVIAFLSQSSVRDPGVCLDELSIAVGVRGGNIKTVLLEPETQVCPPSTVSHIQWLDMSSWREIWQQGEDVFAPWFDEKVKELLQVIESPENTSFPGQISSIREALPLISYDTTKQNVLIRQPFVGRRWLADRVERWLEDPDGSPVCILYGDPGIGKSAFAANYCHYNSRVVAGIFCEHNRQIYAQANSVIQTLAYLLACRMPPYRLILSEILASQPGIGDWNSSDLFTELLAHPLRQCSIDGGHETLCVVIDGLDECGDYRSNPLAEVISRYADRLPRWIRLLVTARSVNAVTGYFQGRPHLDLRGDTTENLEDIEEYFRLQLADYARQNPCPEDFFARLAQHSGGIFLYAKMVIQAFLDGRMRPDAMEALPAGIEQAFLDWFGWFFPDREEYRERFRLPLGLLAFSPEPIPEEEFFRVFSWDENDLADLKQRIGILIREGKNGFGRDTIEVSHKYLKDWLAGGDAGAYQCRPEAAYRCLGDVIFREYADRPEAMTAYEALYLYRFLKETGQTELSGQLARNQGYFLRVSGVGRECMEAGKLSAARTYFAAAHEAAACAAEQSSDHDIRLMYSVSELNLAEICEAEGNLREAMELSLDCWRIRQQLVKERGSEIDRICLGRICERLAGLYGASGDSAREEELLLEGFRIREAAAAQNESAQNLQDLGSNAQILAEFYEREGKNEAAGELFRTSYESRKKQFEKRSGLIDRKDLMVAAIRYATYEMRIGRFAHTETLIGEVTELAESIPENAKNIEISRVISYAYAYRAELLRIRGEMAESEHWYREALRLRRQMAADRGSMEDLWNLGGICVMLGFVYYVEGRYEEAGAMLDQVLAIDRELIKGRGKLEDKRGLGLVWLRKGKVCQAQGKEEEAQECYTRAEAVAEELYRLRGNFDDREDLAMALHHKAALLAGKGKTAEAEEICARALSLREYQAENRGLGDDFKFYGASLLLAARLSRGHGDLAAAEEYYRKSVEADRKLVLAKDSISSRKCLRSACGQLADFYRETGRSKLAEKYDSEARK